MAHPANPGDDKLRAQIRQWLDDPAAAYEAFARVKFKVTPIRKRFRVSPRQLERIFNEEVGKPAMRWMREVRFERTKELLRGGWHLDYAAKKVLYSASSNFCREFKAMTGETPGEYQARFV